MNKNFTFLHVVLAAGILLASCGMFLSPTTPINTHPGNVHEVSAVLQATDVPIPLPTVVIPTIVVNPTPSSTGGLPVNLITILLFVLVAGIIVIALIAVLRR